MGNIVQGCHTVLNYFKCKDALAQNQPETSPLLSSEESECDSLNLDDDLSTVSTGATNPTLEPENFLFPDIILSSNPGGDVTLVEPMVCLLVSEEEEVRMDEPGYRLQKRSNEGRGRECSEVETQTEAEAPISMGVQTQTESQAQTELILCRDETVERGGNTLTSTGARNEVVVDVKEEHKTLQQVLLETQTDTQMSNERHAEIDTETWSESEKRENLTGGNKLPFGDTVQETDQGELGEKHISKDLTAASTKRTFQTGQNTELMDELNTDEERILETQQNTHFARTGHRTLRTQVSVDDEEENTETEHASVMQTEHIVKEKTSAEDSRKNKRPIKYSVNNTEIVETFGPAECGVNQKKKSAWDTEQMGDVTVPSGQTVKGKDYDVIDTKTNPSDEHTDRTAEQSGRNADHVQCQENLHRPKRGEDGNKTGAQQLWELETSLPRVDAEEGGAEMTEMLLSVDRLFRTSHVRAPPSQVGRSPEDDPPEQTDVEESKQLNIREMVDLQDTDFTLRIQAPGSEGFELQVSGQLLVAELHQVLMEHEISCHRTCFSLQLGGTTLHSLTKLCSIQGIQDGAPIKVVEESYSVLDARLHLKHVQHLLRSLHLADAYNGVNCGSLSYLTLCTAGERDRESVGNRHASDFRPPEYLLPGCKDRPLTPLQPLRDDWKPLQCLRVLSTSSWNPPPGNRKMHGDLMYLHVLTMEDKEFNITSSTRGFYLNQSTAFNFNPKPAVPKILCHSLVELLSQVSPAFRKNFSALQKKRVQQHPYERISTPFQVFTWTARQGDHTLGCVRAEDTRMGQDEQHTAGKSRDWNEELQGCRELGRNSLQERLHRERSIFKTNSDFVEAATRGAVAIIDGNVMPLNPGEAAHMHMFICNNLFFSLGFDISEHYRPLGGNPAAHAAAVCDLRGAQAYSSVDIEGLHTPGTAVVDYCGIRVIAQTIIPGILEKNAEQLVVYGSNDYGKTVSTHPRFLELLDKTTKPLRIQRHQVLDHNNSPVELCSGIETKGIMGNDGRPYILDLLRTFPPDLNFQFSEREESSMEVPKECKSFGYPRQHCHSLASLRPELTEAFIQHRYKLYVKMVSQGLIPSEEQHKSMEPSEELIGFQKVNVIMNACEAVGSVSDSCFDIRFNPNVCSPGACLSSERAAEVQRQRLLLWDMAAFLLSHQIPAVLRDCLEHAAVPMDGVTLTSVLHQGGVNVRYLGTLLQELDRMEERGRLSHIHRICVSEVIMRSAKHIFRTYLQDVEPAAYSAAISHFLNCLLSSSSCFPDSCSDELLSRRRSRRRRSHGRRLTVTMDSVWARLTPSELWARIRAEAQDYYHYTIDSESMDEVIEKHSHQRISLLREISIKTGIQVQLRDYVFESRHRPVFGEEDVVNVFPVVKHLKPTGTDATRLLQHAQVAVQQGLLKDAYELIGQALTLFSSVCGVLHEDVCVCLRLLGRLDYIMGEHADALRHQEKAVMISERVRGIDHPQTIQDYTDLALYCFAGGRLSTSLQLLYRARYLTLLVTGEDHPHVALLDSMLGLVLHGLMEYELSLKFLQNAVTLTSKYHGATSMKHAHSHHLLATVYESKGDFQSALQHEKEAYAIFKNQSGEVHDSAKESSEYLESLTQQAVSLRKAINHMCSVPPSACVLPPKLSTPSLPTILHQLNLICGIILIPTEDVFEEGLPEALIQHL